MVKIVHNPDRMNHYDFLNEALDLKKKLGSKVAAGQDVGEQVKIAIKSLRADLLTNARDNTEKKQQVVANIEKLEEAWKIISNEKSKLQYDREQEQKEKISTQSGQSELQIQISKPGNKAVKLKLADGKTNENIKSEFKPFQENFVKNNTKTNGYSYKPEEFNHEEKQLDNGATQHIFTFPDEASAKAFIKQLFDKALASMPDGSSDINDVNFGDFNQKLAAPADNKPILENQEKDAVDSENGDSPLQRGP